MGLFFRKPVIMFSKSLVSSLFVLATRTSLSCSKRPDPKVLTRLNSPAKYVDCGFTHRSTSSCDALLFSGSPTVTFCSVHIHNVVAKKRDASTERLHRLHGYVREHNVEKILLTFQNSTRRHPEREEKNEFCGGRGKKRNFGRSRGRAVQTKP